MTSNRVFLGAWLAAFACSATAADPIHFATPVETPIVAELLGDPDAYIGRRIRIYGLVVAAREDGAAFSLQDVSQVPLPVIAPPNRAVLQGSQLMVYGTLQRRAGQLVLAGDRIEAVTVVAGGGCC